MRGRFSNGLLVVFLCFTFMLAAASVAFAAPLTSWNPPGPTYRDPILPPATNADTPHKSYVAGGDECEICHSPHQAGSGGTSYKLLRAATRDAACDYCHLGAGAKTDKVVYENGKTGQNGHEIAAVPGGVAPDSDVAIPDLDCFDCHSPHGARTIAASKILKEDPAGNGGAAGSETEFCVDCHNKNYNPVDNYATYDHLGISHPMSTGGPHSAASSRHCDSCHSASRGGLYPHVSSGDALLSNGTRRDQIDRSCINACHGLVGTDY